jgi:hypothetical protein
MSYINFFFSYLLLICIPIYIYYRFKKSGKVSLVNIFLYPLILSYLYFCIPSIFIDEFILLLFSTAYGVIHLESSSLENVSIYSQWYTFVFFTFYFFSKDKALFINSSFRPKFQTYKFSKILFVILFFAYVLIIASNLPDILSLLVNRDRAALLDLYAEISYNYRFSTLIYISLAVVYVITWRTRRFYSYSLLFLPILLELLTLGRTMTFLILVFSGINYILISKKPRYIFAFVPLFVLIGTIIIRFDSFKFSLIGAISVFFSDMFLSYLGGVMTYQDFYQQSDIYALFIASSLKILPSFFSDYILDGASTVDIYSVTGEYYKRVMGFGLANNIISEAVYYGGSLFLIASPVIISFILYLLNTFKVYKSFPGFFYILLLISSLRAMFAQSGFYFNFLPLSYLMFSYLIWITYFERNTVFLDYKIRKRGIGSLKLG